MEVYHYPKMSKSLKKLKNKNSIYSPQPLFPKDSGLFTLKDGGRSCLGRGCGCGCGRCRKCRFPTYPDGALLFCFFSFLRSLIASGTSEMNGETLLAGVEFKIRFETENGNKKTSSLSNAFNFARYREVIYANVCT